jgi:hypothetical protein
MDKALVKTMGNIDRPFSVIEAMFSYSMDRDSGHENTLRGYSKLWGWSVGKVLRFIEPLRNTSETLVERKGNSGGTLIRFVSGSSGVLTEHKRNTSGTLAEHKRNTTCNTNTKTNPNKDNSTVENQKIFHPDVEGIFTFWKETLDHPKAKLDGKRKKNIKAVLELGYSSDDIKKAVIGCSISPYHQGQNDRKTKYDDIELICRDAKHLDSFIKIATEKNMWAALTKKGMGNKSVLESWIKGGRSD